ncbi:MAG: hypothetical protein N2258_04950 [Brevinematales bacterium]|nr:hypothetical protein [Brevinematales bacterium]
MYKILVGLLILVSFSNVFGASKEVFASVLFSTSFDNDLPYAIFEGKEWSIMKGSRYSRLDILLDEPTRISKLIIEFKNSFKGYITVYLNDLDDTHYLTPENRKIILSFEKPKTLSSIKFNFNQNDDVVVKNVEIYETANKKYEFKASKVIEGNVKATSTLIPERAYSVYKIFDSKLEDGWSSDKKRTGDIIEFNFDKQQTITAFKIWNGYQRSEVHYKANSRVKKLRLEGDNGYKNTVTVLDKPGPQIVKLNKTFKGKNLKMEILDSYPGTKYNDLVISEMRFFDGKNYFLINPIKFLKNNIEYNRNEFSKAGLKRILDNEIFTESGYEEDSTSYYFRFRSDGSIYIEGRKDKGEISERFFAIGNYEILKAGEEGVDLRLFGYIVNQKGIGKWYDGDCGGGGYDYQYKDATKQIFTEFITISEKSDDGEAFNIKNTGKKRNFFFEELLCYFRY